MTSINPKYSLLKYACYYTYIAMSSIFSLPPLLFVTFREAYGIPYTLLGTLVLVNFCTQLGVDLVFTFFAKHFNIRKTIVLMPVLTSVGLALYALLPMLFPQHAYAGLVFSTFIFSVSAGLSEVLLSPLVAAIPSKTPDRDMSMLHSLYAYGVLTVVVVSSLFFSVFGRENWMYLTLFWAALPLISFVLFLRSPMPQVVLSGNDEAGTVNNRKKILALCVLCIFLGSAAENTMTNWISGYMENALQISKTVGDILGMATFAVCLGIARTAYAKYGRNISSVLLWGMIGATVCYVTAAVSSNTVVCAVACVLTGFCTSMLWPGTLILMEECLPMPGVAAYALMAAGGDFGGSVAPQLLGIVVDTVAASDMALKAPAMGLTADQLGMKTGMLTAAIFPLLGVVLLLYIKKFIKNRGKT